MSQKVNFTKALLLETRPLSNKERIVLWDAKTPGLQCRISHTGNITFSIYKRMKGYAAERVTLGKFPQMSIEQARINAAKINAAVAGGENPAQIKRAHKAELTFEELFNEYLEKCAKQKKKSWPDDECRFRRYIKTPLGNKKLSLIDRSDIIKLHQNITKIKIVTTNGETNRGITANRVLALLSSVFNWGIKNEYCKDNPARAIEKNKEKSRDRFLQPEELSNFFTAVQNESNVNIRDYVLISLYTGARRSNVVSMRWEDISFQHKIWRIPQTKNDEPVVIPLIDEAIEILKARYKKGTVFVFASDSERGHLIDPKKGWKRILQNAGIANLRLHDLRRTLGSWQAIMGSSTLVIGKSLGHKSQKATEVYARLSIDPVRKSIEIAIQAMIKAGEKSIK